MPAKTKKALEKEDQEKSGPRKYLVVVDDSPEFEVAMYYAARLAARMDGVMVMLYVNEPMKTSGWFAIQVDAPDEPAKRARQEIDKFRAKLEGRGLKDLSTESIIRSGDTAEEIIKVIERDSNISVLVLGASVSREGPGPLVSSLARGGRVGKLHLPIIIVPGDLTPEEIEELA